MITIEDIKQMHDTLAPKPGLSEIKVMKSSLIKDGTPILMLSPTDFEEFCKKTDQSPITAYFTDFRPSTVEVSVNE